MPLSDIRNPFDIVKATDLNDAQILTSFVDLPGGSSLLQRLKPTSRMPMIIFGGKGSGKTHLMRYISYPLQKRRCAAGTRLIDHLAREQYLGIYLRCGGLNAQRFSGKNQSDDTWQDIFAYYMELWLSQLLISTAIDISQNSPGALRDEARLASRIVELMDIRPKKSLTTLADVLTAFSALQREADVAINNSSLSRRLDIVVTTTRGRLVFGIPAVLADEIIELKDSLFLLLFDEFENLTESQQLYVNTLLRERQDPCGVKIGVRLYGLRTLRTLAAREENREDSEFEALRLDTEFRERPQDDQAAFARALVCRRLTLAGVAEPTEAELDSWFETDEQDALRSAEAGQIRTRYGSRDLPYLGRLAEKLSEGMRLGVAPGLATRADIDRVLNDIRFLEYPFLERANVMLLYKAWAHRANLLQAAVAIRSDAVKLSQNMPEGTLHTKLFRHFRADVVAQLLRDIGQPQRYLGFSTFVRMSAGLPRCLLTILKHVFTWAQFLGEDPFRKGRISVAAQTEAVSQAAEWFFTDARAPGPEGTAIRDGMTRLGQLLRALRYADKPSECSLSTFSADVTTATEQARQTLDRAAQWSMLVTVAGGQVDRNLGRVDTKYQVHPMLAPRWDLPIARRGSIALSGEEVTAIFAPRDTTSVATMVARRESLTMAPMFGKQANGRVPVGTQETLPGFDDDLE